MPFPPSAAGRFFDLPPVNLQNLPLHLTKNSFASAPSHLCGIALITFYVLLLLMLTLIYAHADTEMKRRAIEKASSDICEVNARSAVPDVLDDDTLKRLYGLQ